MQDPEKEVWICPVDWKEMLENICSSSDGPSGGHEHMGQFS